jgi:molybdate transport system regulatory protein
LTRFTVSARSIHEILGLGQSTIIAGRELDNVRNSRHNPGMKSFQDLNVFPRVKLWIVDSEDDILMGGGRQSILEVIERTGSMNKAAAELGMSYRTLWGKIRETEQRLGYALVENKSKTKRGGSRLTAEGTALLERFKRFADEAENAVADVFKSVFRPDQINQGSKNPGV